MATPKQRITIGNSYKDIELVDGIIRYKEYHNLNSAADAVRELCNKALNVDKALNDNSH